MTNPFKSPQFQKLNKKWAKKLEQSNFKDIETNDNYENLKEWDSSRFKIRYTPIEFEANARYYQLASQLLHDYPFLSSTEKRIWKLHSEGESIRRIAATVGVSAKTVQTRISRIQKCIVPLKQK